MRDTPAFSLEPWERQPEAIQEVLRRIRIPGEEELVQVCFWNFLLGEAAAVIRDAKLRGSHPGSFSRQRGAAVRKAKAQERAARALKRTAPEQAREHELRARVYRFQAEEAGEIEREIRKALGQPEQAPRHETHPATSRVLGLLDTVERAIGRPHCEEIARLLTLAGYPITAAELRMMRLNYGRQRRRARPQRSKKLAPPLL